LGIRRGYDWILVDVFENVDNPGIIIIIEIKRIKVLTVAGRCYTGLW
jgi:hypothetical protein